MKSVKAGPGNRELPEIQAGQGFVRWCDLHHLMFGAGAVQGSSCPFARRRARAPSGRNGRGVGGWFACHLASFAQQSVQPGLL